MAYPAVNFANNFEKKLPIVEIGYIAYQFGISRGRQTSNAKATWGVAGNNNGEIQITKDFNNISNQIKFGLATKWKPDWNKVCDAVKQRNFAYFVEALLPGLELTAEGKTGLKFPFGELNYQTGIDFGILPILFKGIYKPLNQRGLQRQYQISVQIGPSTKGWAYIASKVGGETLKNFLFTNGVTIFRSVYAALIANGLFMAMGAATGAISFGIFSLTAIYAEHRARQGEIAGLSTWYVSAYQRRLYGESIHALKVQYFRGDQALRNQLIESGAYDAVKDAKDFIIKADIKMENPNDDLEALGRYGSALAEKYNTKTAEETKNAIFNPLMQKAKAMFNR